MSHLLHRKIYPATIPTSPTASVLTVAILIVSTTAAKDPSTDASGQLLRDFFAANSTESLRWEVVDSQIVSDDADAIKGVVRAWASARKAVNLIVTTGGTGFAMSDGTPEAVKELLQKEAPGLV